MSVHRASHDRRALERLEHAAGLDGPPQGALRMLEDVVGERRVKLRDCRSCKNFNGDESGLGFGWCGAHDQYVKLYHPPEGWFSQCTFKALRRFKPQELERMQVAAELAAQERGW